MEAGGSPRGALASTKMHSCYVPCVSTASAHCLLSHERVACCFATRSKSCKSRCMPAPAAQGFSNIHAAAKGYLSQLDLVQIGIILIEASLASLSHNRATHHSPTLSHSARHSVFHSACHSGKPLWPNPQRARLTTYTISTPCAVQAEDAASVRKPGTLAQQLDCQAQATRTRTRTDAHMHMQPDPSTHLLTAFGAQNHKTLTLKPKRPTLDPEP